MRLLSLFAMALESLNALDRLRFKIYRWRNRKKIREFEENFYYDESKPGYPVIKRKVTAMIGWIWRDNKLFIEIDGVEYRPSEVKNCPDEAAVRYVLRKINSIYKQQEKYERTLKIAAQ